MSCTVPQRPWKSGSGFPEQKLGTKQELPMSEAARCFSQSQNKRMRGHCQKSELEARVDPYLSDTELESKA